MMHIGQESINALARLAYRLQLCVNQHLTEMGLEPKTVFVPSDFTVRRSDDAEQPSGTHGKYVLVVFDDEFTTEENYWANQSWFRVPFYANSCPWSELHSPGRIIAWRLADGELPC